MIVAGMGQAEASSASFLTRSTIGKICFPLSASRASVKATAYVNSDLVCAPQTVQLAPDSIIK